jgi:hypothetical protein
MSAPEGSVILSGVGGQRPCIQSVVYQTKRTAFSRQFRIKFFYFNQLYGYLSEKEPS